MYSLLSTFCPAFPVGQLPPLRSEGGTSEIHTNLGGVIQGEHRISESKMLQGKILHTSNGICQDSDTTAGFVVDEPDRLGLYVGDTNRHQGVGIIHLPIIWPLHRPGRQKP